MKKLIATLPLVLVLGACGGSGGDGSLVLSPALPDTGDSSGGDTASGGQPDAAVVDSGSGNGGSSVVAEPDTDAGSTDSTDNTDNADNTNSELVPEEPYVAEAGSTAELSSDGSFDFKTQWEMNVDFDISAATGTSGYLSICTEYEFDGEDSYGVNFDKCAVRAPIVDGLFNAEMNVTNDVTALLAVIWFADQSSPPVYNEFELVNGQESIVWR